MKNLLTYVAQKCILLLGYESEVMKCLHGQGVQRTTRKGSPFMSALILEASLFLINILNKKRFQEQKL